MYEDLIEEAEALFERIGRVKAPVVDYIDALERLIESLESRLYAAEGDKPADT